MAEADLSSCVYRSYRNRQTLGIKINSEKLLALKISRGVSFVL